MFRLDSGLARVNRAVPSVCSVFSVVKDFTTEDTETAERTLVPDLASQEHLP